MNSKLYVVALGLFALLLGGCAEPRERHTIIYNETDSQFAYVLAQDCIVGKTVDGVPEVLYDCSSIQLTPLPKSALSPPPASENATAFDLKIIEPQNKTYGGIIPTPYYWHGEVCMKNGTVVSESGWIDACSNLWKYNTCFVEREVGVVDGEVVVQNKTLCSTASIRKVFTKNYEGGEDYCSIRQVISEPPSLVSPDLCPPRFEKIEPPSHFRFYHGYCLDENYNPPRIVHPYECSVVGHIFAKEPPTNNTIDCYVRGGMGLCATYDEAISKISIGEEGVKIGDGVSDLSFIGGVERD